MVAGLTALLATVVWLCLQPGLLTMYHYNQNIIALTHLVVLGWISTIVMGAMYQLVPVALETRLYSERLAKCQFFFHVIGAAGMIWMFKAWNMKGVGHFGTVLAIGVLLFAYNIGRTLLRVPSWSVVASSVGSASGWIMLTVLAGLSIATAKSGFDMEESGSGGWVFHFLQSVGTLVGRFNTISAMHAHAHLGAIGFFTVLIVGVSYKLIPMFTLSEVQSRLRAGLSIALLNAGVAGVFICILVRSPWKPAFAALITGALALYGREMAAILKTRKRGALDWGLRYFLTAIALLAPLTILAMVLSWPSLPLTTFTGQLENAYGFGALFGFVSFAIMGMLYKIIPFLVWFATYSRHIGRAKVPALADMYSARVQAIGYWSFLAGLVVTIGGTLLSNASLVRIGGGCLALSVTCLLANVFFMLQHFFRPRTMPFEIRQAGAAMHP